MSAGIRSARQAYLDGLADGRFLYQFDLDAGRAVFYPREVGPSGRVASLVWRESAGHATLHSFTDVKSRAGDFNVVLVDLDEGFRMMSTVIGVAPGGLSIGMRLRARIDSSGEGPRIVFAEAA